MKLWIITLAAIALPATLIYFAPKCQGEGSFRIGGMLIYGCK